MLLRRERGRLSGPLQRLPDVLDLLIAGSLGQAQGFLQIAHRLIVFLEPPMVDGQVVELNGQGGERFGRVAEFAGQGNSFFLDLGSLVESPVLGGHSGLGR